MWSSWTPAAQEKAGLAGSPPGRGCDNTPVTGARENTFVTRTGDPRQYAGHGTFVAGVIRAIAPKCTVQVLNLLVDTQAPGRRRSEAELVRRALDALDGQELPT